MTSVKEATRMGRPRELDEPERTFLNMERRINEALKQRAKEKGFSKSRAACRILLGQDKPLILSNVG